MGLANDLAGAFGEHVSEQVSTGFLPSERASFKSGLIMSAAMAVALGAVFAGHSSPLEGWDTKADWITSKAAWTGVDPYAPVDELSERLQIPIGAFPDVDATSHPRLPGSLLLQSILLLVSPDTAVLLVQMAGVASVGILTARLLGRTCVRRPIVTLYVVAAIAISAPVIYGLFFATLSPVLAILALGVISNTRRGNDARAGIYWGVMVILKLSPALIAIPFCMTKRWRPVIIGSAFFIAINLVGMFLFNITVEDTIAGLASTSSDWLPFSGNHSLAGGIVQVTGSHLVAVAAGIAVALTATLYFSARSHSLSDSLSFATVLAVIGSPLAWVHYQLVAIPAISESKLASFKGGVPIAIGWVSLWLVQQMLNMWGALSENVMQWLPLGIGLVVPLLLIGIGDRDSQ